MEIISQNTSSAKEGIRLFFHRLGCIHVFIITVDGSSKCIKCVNKIYSPINDDSSHLSVTTSDTVNWGNFKSELRSTGLLLFHSNNNSLVVLETAAKKRKGRPFKTSKWITYKRKPYMMLLPWYRLEHPEDIYWAPSCTKTSSLVWKMACANSYDIFNFNGRNTLGNLPEHVQNVSSGLNPQ